MDTGLRRYDGTESLLFAQIIAARVFSKEDTARRSRNRRFGIFTAENLARQSRNRISIISRKGAKAAKFGKIG